MEGYVEAYVLFGRGRQSFIAKKYNEAIDFFRRAYNLVGGDGLRMLENLFEGTSVNYVTQQEFHATMCKSYYQIGEYEKALEQANMWRVHIIQHYGNDSILLVDCYKQLALIHAKLKLPEKQFEEERGNYHSWTELFNLIKIYVQVYPLSLLNLQLPMDYYMKAYNLLKAKQGSSHPDTKNLKQEIVDFQWGEWLAMQIEKSLWIATFLVPLLIMLIPLLFGLTWKALSFFAVYITFFIIWRIADAAWVSWMTYRHYQNTIN